MGREDGVQRGGPGDRAEWVFNAEAQRAGDAEGSDLRDNVSCPEAATDDSLGDWPDSGGERRRGAMGHRDAGDRRHGTESPGVHRYGETRGTLLIPPLPME